MEAVFLEKLTLADIIKAVGGRQESGADCEITEVSTDTRDISKGSLFIPIRGERFDGHDFVAKAFEAGAAAVLADRDIKGKCVVRVSDTRKAYLDLAGWYRRRFPVTVVGITGSVGKTTTKEMVAAVLESRYKTLKTEGNFNNEIGLPRTLLRLDSSYQTAVIEMGMSHFGEISRLAKAAAPNMGVITNIGVSHIENLGSREGILKAKLEILDGMDEHAPLLLNSDNDLLSQAADELEREIITYGIDSPHADICAVNIQETGLTTEFDIVFYGKKAHTVLPAIGKHNVLNALAAFAVGLINDVDPQAAVAALEQYTPAGMRQRIVDRRGMMVIEDCYNASPDSMLAALHALSAVGCTGRRIAVLSDMLELGSYSVRAHYDVGRAVAQSKADLLFCTGTDAAYIVKGAKEAGMDNAMFYPQRDDLVRAVRETVRPGDCLLFKASRGMKLEELMEKICGES